MRVLLVNAHGADPEFGGAERYVRDLASGLLARGHEVAVLSAFPPRAEAGVRTRVLHRSDWRDSQLRRLRNHAGDVISAPWPRLRRILRGARPDLVHTSNLPGIGSGVWEVAGSLGVPVVHTLHDYYLLCPRTTLTRKDGRPCDPSPALCGARTRRLARWTGSVGHLIAGSDHLVGIHRDLFPDARKRVIRLPLVPMDGPPPEGSGPPLRTVGYLGALRPTKGIELLIEAAPALAGDGVEVRVAGDGPMRAQVEASRLRYAGRLEGEAKDDFIRSCDAGVVPSLWEEPSGPPYVVCEWLAARRPALATRRGGLAEATVHGGVVPFDATAEGLVEAVARLRDADEWRRVVAATPVVDDDADSRRWLEEHEDVYRAAIGSRARAR